MGRSDPDRASLLPTAAVPSLLRRARTSAFLLIVLSSAANVVNYLSTVVFSRILEPVGFGELTSLLALSVILAVPLGAAQTVVAERIATAAARNDPQHVRYLIRHALGHVLTLGVLTGAAYGAAIPLVMNVLEIREPGPALALIPLIVLAFVNPVTQGALQGLQKFTAFGVLIFATAISRLAFGVPWVLQGGGAGGAIAGQALGMAAVTLLMGWLFRQFLIGRGTGAASAGLRRRLNVASLSASVVYLAFAALANLDVLLARVFLEPYEAGLYAAVSTVGKIVLFLPTAIATVMVPRTVQARVGGQSEMGVLRRSVRLVLVSSAACLLPCVVAPSLVVDVMFGADYADAAPGVLPMGIAGAGLALLYLFLTYSVTVRTPRWNLLLGAGVVLQVAAIGAFHGSLQEIAWAQAATVVVVLAVNEIGFLSLRRERPRAFSPTESTPGLD